MTPPPTIRPDDQRVVITGLGWTTPLGCDLQTVWQRLLAGEHGVGPIRQFDASTFPTTFCASVDREAIDPALLAAPEHEGALPNTLFALAAARAAWINAGFADPLDPSAAPGDPRPTPQRTGIYLGSGEGPMMFDGYARTNLDAWSEESRAIDAAKWAQAALQHMGAISEVEQEANMPASHLAMLLDAQGPVFNCLTACAASTQAIGEATHLLRRGDVDVMVTGGAHTMVHPLGVSGFNRLTALSTRNDDPAHASRPFSADRDGFVMGEGAGILILERLEHAVARGATPLAEVIGYGSSTDAYRITDMHPTGRGPAAAMSAAFADAGLSPEDIDYISVHGTSTKENDQIETRAIKAVFQDHAPNVPMSSVKSMLGHLIAAAGAVEAIVCVMAMQNGMVPPTINLANPDPDCDLDYTPNAARKVDVKIALSNNYGFGGQNDSIILRKWNA